MGCGQCIESSEGNHGNIESVYGQRKTMDSESMEPQFAREVFMAVSVLRENPAEFIRWIIEAHNRYAVLS